MIQSMKISQYLYSCMLDHLYNQYNSISYTIAFAGEYNTNTYLMCIGVTLNEDH